MKEQILKLRGAGFTYEQISNELRCSKGTVCYHCGVDQKEKSLARQRRRRSGVSSPKKSSPQKPKCLNCDQPVKWNTSKYCCRKCQHLYMWSAKKTFYEKMGHWNGVTCEGAARVLTKRYLIEVKGHRCEVCGLREWLGKSIPLVLDHINGKSWEIGLANVRLICGNCDMQSPTYKNRNFGNGRHARKIRFREGKSY